MSEEEKKNKMSKNNNGQDLELIVNNLTGELRDTLINFDYGEDISHTPRIVISALITLIGAAIRTGIREDKIIQFCCRLPEQILENIRESAEVEKLCEDSLSAEAESFSRLRGSQFSVLRQRELLE